MSPDTLELYNKLLEQFPDADKDLLKHYAEVNTMNSFQRMFLPLGKEVGDWLGATGSKTGFSWDDIGADIAGAYLTPEQANKKGLFTHTEPADMFKGVGQGLFKDVFKKFLK
jgi:hypothetical protein|tara:strand:+ start:108 stop:443 length:336 start_codon:yes stop_codon:yes gene_type:complete